MDIAYSTPREDGVLVAIDGTPAAATALPVARALAAQLGVATHVLHVAPPGPTDATGWQRLNADLQAGETVQVRAWAGEPSEAILQETERPGLVLTVLTTHGREIEPGRALGRVARSVLAGCRRPILLVRPEATVGRPVEPVAVRRLLVPVDGTPSTAVALAPATELACWLGAEIDLLHVLTPDSPVLDEPGSIGAPRYVDQPQHEWRHWAREVEDRLCRSLAQCPAGVPVQMYLGHGRVEDEVGRFADSLPADMVVLARRSHLEPGRATVLQAVLDRCAVPVLVVNVADESAQADVEARVQGSIARRPAARDLLKTVGAPAHSGPS